jgi:hypothetical protein
MLQGSCLCGGIKYQVNGRLSGGMNCHCSMCRKAQGSAFRSRAAVKSAEFEFGQGEELITFYESVTGNSQGFLPGMRVPDPEQVRRSSELLWLAAGHVG